MIWRLFPRACSSETFLRTAWGLPRCFWQAPVYPLSSPHLVLASVWGLSAPILGPGRVCGALIPHSCLWGPGHLPSVLRPAPSMDHWDFSGQHQCLPAEQGLAYLFCEKEERAFLGACKALTMLPSSRKKRIVGARHTLTIGPLR